MDGIPSASANRQTLTYRPGDALWASLPLRDDWMFTWVRCHSLRYQFERLTRPPRLHKSNATTTSGTLEEEVRLTILPADGVPRVPDLMPVVRLSAVGDCVLWRHASPLAEAAPCLLVGGSTY